MADNWSKISSELFRMQHTINQSTRYGGGGAGRMGFDIYGGNPFEKAERMMKNGKNVSGGKKKKKKKKKEKSNKEKILDWEQSRMINLEPDDPMEEAPMGEADKARPEGNKEAVAPVPKGSVTAPSAENARYEPSDLQQAVLWAEILGEPVSVRRRKKRMNQFNGNQGNAYRR